MISENKGENETDIIKIGLYDKFQLFKMLLGETYIDIT